MQIIKIRAKFAKEIEDAIIAEAGKDIPEDVKRDIHEMAIIRKEVEDRMSEARAVPLAGIERFNKLAYKHFGKAQDGGEFEKVEPELEVPVIQKRPGGIPTVCDEKALDLVHNYIINHLDKSDPEIPNFSVFIVWKAKILQNWKWLLASTLPDGMYYELTYNGDKEEYYLDAYRKVDNKVIRGGALE